VKVDATDEGGQTALHMAADAGAVESLKLLLEHGADPKAADQYGISVLQAAVIAGHVKISKILIEHGADPDQADEDGDTPRNCAVDDGSADMRFLFRIGGSSKDERIMEEETSEDDSEGDKIPEGESEMNKSSISWDTEEGASTPSHQVVIDPGANKFLGA